MKTLLAATLVCATTLAIAQSETTNNLHKKFDAQAFFFYNNTLRMLNQKEDPGFDELIKNIEKMKFLMIDKAGHKVDYKRVVSDYKAERFEEAMSSRYEGKSFDIYFKGDKKTEGMVVLVNDDQSLMVLDIVGSIALDKVTSLWSTLDSSTDIGKRIRDFTDGGDRREKEKRDN